MSARKGFTVIGLLVVLGILLFLIALLAPFVQQTRDKASKTEVLNHLKMLGLANHAFNDQYKKLPPAYGMKGGITASCLGILAPYYESDARTLVNGLDYSWTDKDGNARPQGMLPRLGNKPGEGIVASGFAANYYVFGDQNTTTMNKAPVTMKDPKVPDTVTALGYGDPYTPLAVNTIRDGTSNTIMHVTAFARCDGRTTTAYDAKEPLNAAPSSSKEKGPQTGPFTVRLTWDAAPELGGFSSGCLAGQHAQAYAKEGIQIGLCDGGARTIMAGKNKEGDHTTTSTIFRAAMLPNDNQVPQWEY
jgi:type II secretory pathway pseudopilin PulG